MSKKTTKVKLQILVFKGDPDLPTYRHTALFVEGNGESVVCHIVGEAPNFRYDMEAGYQPTASKRLLKKITVGEIAEVKMAKVGAKCYRTPIKSGGHDSRWNCQNWVEDALAAICEEKWITENARSLAINEMWETVNRQQEGDIIRPSTVRHAKGIVHHSVPNQQSAPRHLPRPEVATQSLRLQNRHDIQGNPDAATGERVGNPLFPRSREPYPRRR